MKDRVTLNIRRAHVSISSLVKAYKIALQHVMSERSNIFSYQGGLLESMSIARQSSCSKPKSRHPPEKGRRQNGNSRGAIVI